MIVRVLKGADRALSARQRGRIFDRAVRGMSNVTDLERRAVREIVSMYEDAVRVANWASRNPDSVFRRDLPTIDPVGRGRSKGYEYFGIVVIRDKDSGAEERIPVTVKSKERLQFSDWAMKAYDTVDKRKLTKKYRNKLEQGDSWELVEAILISINGTRTLE